MNIQLSRHAHSTAHFIVRLLWVWVCALWFAAEAAAASPVLLVTSKAAPTPNFGPYYAEIFRTEGLNAFDSADLSAVTPTLLAGYDLVLLAKMPLSAAQATIFSNWVTGGGNLIAMAPDPQLAGLLGLTRSAATTLANAYLLVDPQAAVGGGTVAGGIVSQTIQFHGSADLYTLNGARALATLYTTATSATPAANPAITWRAAGSGQAAAFTYDLAASVVYTRQGNPAWAAQERDGFTPIRSDDKFFGAAANDPKPDWVDLNKVAIPQADEQQRLLANLILKMNLAKKPLPRFWYFPFGKRAAIVMTGDDHGNGGTAGRFDQYLAASPAGCVLANWECVRGTSYIYPNTPISNTQAANYNGQGFEVGLHVTTNCADFTADTTSSTSLEQTYVSQLATWKNKYTSLPAPITQRHHCIVWSDWATGAKVELNHGMRLDTTYYFWPPGWVNDVPGLFTGSAMPMRFADLNGALIDVYNAATQMTDESGQTYPKTVDALLDRALGAEGYFGAYVVNAHTDQTSSSVSDAVLASAQARGVPIVSAKQMLTWLDARNASAIGDFAWNGATLNFSITPASGATGLQAMLPLRSASGTVQSITSAGSAVAYTVIAIKGIEYAQFTVPAGAKRSYAAAYAADTAPPTVTTTVPAASATGVAVNAAIKVSFSKAIDTTTLNSNTVQLLDAASKPVAATIAYDAASFTATLTPSGALNASAAYTVTVKGGTADPRVKDVAGNALATNKVWSFTTGAGFNCPCTVWPTSATPATPDVNDSDAVELGMKFRSDVSGSITGIRFYKGSTAAGNYVVNLWNTGGGQPLATATVTLSASAAGWQQVNFATPVAITANTSYIASYFAPAGRYAANNGFFVSTGVDNGPLHALSNTAGGGNGVYTYNSVSTFPSSTYQSSNYWVDVVLSTSGTPPPPPPPPTNACTAPANPIVAENCQAGSSGWDISGAGDASIQGFATQISAKPGDTVSFKVKTSAAAYRFDIYRIGYYGGLGARQIATVSPSARLPQTQPACLTDAASGLIDCGNWAVSGSWTVPANAVSGIYFAKVVRTDTGGASHIVFVVRNDSTATDLLFQTSDTTWQAYNDYGGKSLYSGGPGTSPARAYKVSYNRPFNTRAVDGGQDWVFNAEYPMVRWLEANGYNVSYAAGADSDRAGAAIRQHKVFMSVGHDEYWSAGQRANVEAARNAGVNLAFFSGNESFWKTRWENSIDGSSSAYRTLVTYKETHAGAQIDPLDKSPTWIWTGTWRDPRFSPPADGGRPENAMTGTLFMVNDGATTAITVPAADGKMRFWRNTSVATLASGATATLPNGTLGYEWDVDADNGARPPGLFRLSTTTVNNAPVLQDFGSNFGSGTATHSLTLYRHSSGALVFGAGTVQWPWGLDATHDRGGVPADARMQQATVNLLADMGVQPATLQSGMIAATASSDTAAPSSLITAPAAGASLPAGTPVTITGTAADNGGGQVGGVEVSTDNGATWHPANGRGNWSYVWTPSGAATLKSRAVDDSGNIETPSAGISINVGARNCPCSLWSSGATPAVLADSDTDGVELGLKFQADRAGTISGIRFYKGSTITGTYVVNLWDANGNRLATASVALGTATGWQQVNFPAPLPALKANTTYVASYFAPQGRYPSNSSYFANAGFDNAPLHALGNTASGGNGVYRYGTGSGFPSSTFQATNYWVDVVFAPSGP